MLKRFLSIYSIPRIYSLFAKAGWLNPKKAFTIFLWWYFSKLKKGII